jgi:hypothetical protein
MTATAEPPRTQVNLVALAEPDRLLHPAGSEAMAHPIEAERSYTTSVEADASAIHACL